MAATNKDIEKELNQYLHGISKGFQQGGIRPNVKAVQIEKVCKTIAMGNEDEFGALILDIVGEVAGLAAGTSLMAKEAMESLCDAQSMLFVDCRDRFNATQDTPVSKENLHGCQQLLMTHKKSLVEWVTTGKTTFNGTQIESELSQFSSLLNESSLRLGVIAVFLGGIEVAYQGLLLFTSTNNVSGSGV